VNTTIKVKENKNRVPAFLTSLKNVLVPLMNSYNYTLPRIIDSDYGDHTSVSTVEDLATGALPSFITF
jgi:hypothetical protein